MNSRRKIQFKVDNTVMVEELRDLSIEEIERMKVLVAQECDCTPEDVEVDTVEAEVEMSEDIDLAVEGLVFWRSLSFDPIVGVMCDIDENSDEFIDMLTDYRLNINMNKTLEKLSFFI